MGKNEYEEYMKTGISTFKCTKCVKARNDRMPSTPLRTQEGNKTYSMVESEAVISETILTTSKSQCSYPQPKSASTSGTNNTECCSCSSVVQVSIGEISDAMNILMKKVQLLTSEVQELKDMNKKLRDELRGKEHNKTYVEVLQTNIPTGNQTRAGATTIKQTSNITQGEANTTGNVLNGSKNDTTKAAIVDTKIDNTTKSDTKTKKVNTTRGNSYTSVVKQPRKGTKVNTVLKPANKTEKMYTMFVTRFDPTVASSDITSFIKDQKGITVNRCERLKTKFDTYASFYLEVKESEYEDINDEELWPEGILFTRFFGKLDPSRIDTKQQANLNDEDKQEQEREASQVSRE